MIKALIRRGPEHPWILTDKVGYIRKVLRRRVTYRRQTCHRNQEVILHYSRVF